MKKRRNWIWLVVLIGVAVIGAGGYAYSQGLLLPASADVEPTEESVNTAVVRRGDLTISASGSGAVIPAVEYDLGFSTSDAKVAELSVVVGGFVKTGDVLAAADNLDELEATVNAAEIDLLLAKEELQSLYDNAAIAVAEAELALANAKITQEDAWRTDYYSTGQRCNEIQIDLYEIYYNDAVEARVEAETDNDGSSRALEKLLDARDTERQSLANLNYCLGMTDVNEAAVASADLEIADITVQKAEIALQKLQDNEGIDPEEKLQKELAVAQAELALETAQYNLDNAILKSPIDGIVTAVNAYVGQQVGTSSFITVADLHNTTVSVYVDETDMDKIAVGYEIEVEFDAIPDRIFYGTIQTVYPSLQTSGNMNVIYATAILSSESLAGTEYLLEGMNAAIEVIGGRTENAILVPVEALRSMGNGNQYAVFVMEENEPILRFVEVGLMDYYYAEILSGLKQGEVVTTGIVEVE
ncbi:MAG: efflux RND transporter periplasmic adaptor subunit [Anaerolineaceae bacterium]|nr:efflux RND transporter periplasmic adaptor subunit [Anaerolineaceae bacterium]